jgi:hypothetical protein
MEIDLHKPMIKEIDESERVLQPPEIVENALEAVRSISIDLSIEVKDLDQVFWISRLSWKTINTGETPKPQIRKGGKGLNLQQWHASGSPDIAIPVVKNSSGYDPNYSLVSRKELGAFFDF